MSMRRCFSALLLIAMVFPLAAQSRRRAVSAPAQAAPADALRIGQISGASVTGTVASVSGTVITLDTAGAAAVRIEAADAKIIAGDRLVQTIADVVPGARVTAFVERAGDAAVLTARLVVVESRPDLMLVGRVDSVDLSAPSFTVLGVEVAVDDETEFTAAFPTFAPVDGIEDLHPGNVVKVDASLPGGVVRATRVLIVAPDLPPLPVTLRGTVTSISATAWVISGDGGATSILIGDRTRIVGEPVVGDEVQVIAQQNDAGDLVALVIVKIGPIDSIHVQFAGWVQSIGAAEWRIGGPPGLPTPSVTVRITAETEIYPDPKPGDLVSVKAVVGEDRVPVATSITRTGR